MLYSVKLLVLIHVARSFEDPTPPNSGNIVASSGNPWTRALRWST